ncbi:molybdopterin-dependent oxidoreductase-like protein [Actinomycetospora succinea]|uniref:Molybdopterin-dependent oxidoreductase-like protein n=1 Tax=Actinomycetospora succinea TaxID=663603 RepID=A0A4R6VDI4_9PSEU|nr:molybdopterin-dependent oxidoreductase [Actinomycetospora succinea]TDQ58794.1 molybdopterin-dependent oxidoreductase-like protein [Actinomycetospora succinea]
MLMDPATTTKRIPGPERLRERVTDVDDVYLIGHFGVAHVHPGSWRLRVGGDVATPLDLDLPALRAMPSVDVPAVLECFGNPLVPGEFVRRAANVVWHGVPVAALLEAAGAAPASALWATGSDSGVFDDVACTEYRKDVPLAVARERAIVALGMNGAPLTDEHGAPARFVVPGYFGTNNVKWLRELTIAEERPEHLFTTRLYQRRLPGDPTLRPVRDLDVTSVVTTPLDGDRTGGDVAVSGWAWGAFPVATVEVGVDGHWRPAVLEPRGEHRTWQRFALGVALPPGDHVLAARATDAEGRVQPAAGARNAVHEVRVVVGT